MGMIELADVVKRYDGLVDNKDSGIALWVKNAVALTTNKAPSTLALDGVSLAVERGEILGVYGANGAGKTTLIKIVAGLLSPTSGSVAVDSRTDTKGIKAAVSYVSTNGWMGLEWQLTARENLVLYGNLFGLSGRRLARRCDEMLGVVGMEDDAGKRVNELSAGMRQKITIARGLILDRPVIFYDEPSVSLDVPSARGLRDMIRTDAARHHRTAIIASHTPEDLVVCDRIVFLSHGHVLGVGTLDELSRPLAGTGIVEMTLNGPEPAIDFAALPGVVSVITDRVGASGTHRVRLHTDDQGFSFDALIDALLAAQVDVRGVGQAEPSVQDVYEWYVARADGRPS